MDRKYFFEMGAYDDGLQIWGGENFELSFKVSWFFLRTVHLWLGHVFVCFSMCVTILDSSLGQYIVLLTSALVCLCLIIFLLGLENYPTAQMVEHLTLIRKVVGLIADFTFFVVKMLSTPHFKWRNGQVTCKEWLVPLDRILSNMVKIVGCCFITEILLKQIRCNENKINRC